MIVVDTAVWADWFNGVDSSVVDRLDHALGRQDAGLVPVILTEVLQGFRSDRDFERAHVLLIRLPMLTLDREGHVAAARLFRRLRSRGVTVPGTIDCIIAQICITAGVELLSTDQDFAAIARHTPLRLWAG
ncbi:MAG: type II toxin-antitoxin system VapC family toxin [Candidatus Rokuibacteriota bacterium]